MDVRVGLTLSPKKGEHQRTDAFELWCWRLLRVPWPARRSNQSILKEISSEYSLEGLMLRLKLQYMAIWWEELTHWKRPWCWERLKAGGEGDDRGCDGWMASPIRWTWVWASSGSWWWTGKPGLLHTLSHKELDRTEQLNWTDSFCLYWAIFPFSVLFWDPKFPFHLFFETLNLLIGLCFKSERVQSCNLYARIKILSLTFCML